MTIGCTSIRNAPIVTVMNTKIHSGFNSGSVMSLKLLPSAGMIHLCRFVESGIDILQAAQEDDHLISHTLPYAHDGDGRKCLIRTVDERLGVDPEVCKQSIQDAFRAVDLHPQSGDDRQRHNDRYEKMRL